NDLLPKIEQWKSIKAALGCFIHYNDIKYTRNRFYGIPNPMERHYPCRNCFATCVEMLLGFFAPVRRVNTMPASQLMHCLLPCHHMLLMFSFQPRETERPGIKRGKLHDNAVYLVLDLLGALGEGRSVFLPDVFMDPVP